MHIKIDKKHFLKSLNKVQGVVEKKHTLPILANVKMTAQNSRLELYTTDTDIAVISSVECEILEAGVVTAPVHLLHDIVRKISEDSLIDIKKLKDLDNILIKTPGGEFTIPSLPADSFPDFEIAQKVWSISVNAVELYGLFSAVKHAMSLEEIRYYLNGAYLCVDFTENDKKLIAVATDSHRMAISQMRIEEAPHNTLDVIVPRKTVHELLSIIEDIDGRVDLEFYQNKIAVVATSEKIISKLIDGKFPEYKKAIPVKSDIMAIIPSQKLSRAIDLVTTIAVDKTKSVKLEFNADRCRVFVNAQNNSYATQEIQQIQYNGKELIEIAFNSKYLIDILSVIGSADVEFSLTAAHSAVLINATTKSSEFFVLMPMQLA